MYPSKDTADFLECISKSWVTVFGDMTTLTLDGERGMRAKEVDDWAIYKQITLKFKAPHQKIW